MKSTLILPVLALALALTACAEDEVKTVDPTTGKSVKASEQNKSGKPPTVVLKPARVDDDKETGDFSASDFKEIHLTMANGKVVVCVLNAYSNTIDTCDWDNPIKDPTDGSVPR